MTATIAIRKGTSSDYRRTRRYSVNNCGLTRGWRVWDAALQVYALGGRRFARRVDAEPVAAELEAARRPLTIHRWTVNQLATREQRPAAALWMRPEMPASYTYKSEADALAFVRAQRDPAQWEIVHGTLEY